MRILSLLPAATEIIFLLGLEKNLVGVSHECDFPRGAKKLPKVTSSPISNNLSSLQIDKEIKKLSHSGTGVFHIDSDLLKKLKPDLILTQEICNVCAVGFNEVRNSARILNQESFRHSEPTAKNLSTSLRSNNVTEINSEIPRFTRNDNYSDIISLEPESVGDILENILLIGEKTGKLKKAQTVVKSLQKRIEKVMLRLAALPQQKNSSSLFPERSRRGTIRPSVLVIEWLDPIMIAGHWVPEMVELAGGTSLLSKAGQKSVYISSEELKKLNPDIVIFAPCGFNIKRTLKEKDLIQKIASYLIPNTKYYLMDGNFFLTRPGPRIVDGIEIFSEIFFPQVFPKKHKILDWVQFEAKKSLKNP